MISGSIEVLGMQWVGSRSIAAEFGPLIGSLVVAVVAAYAARLAARTANQRQQEQLEHDTKRQEEVLAQDAERLREQLEHDTAVRGREHARDALDAGIELVAEVTDVFGDLLGSVEICEEQREALAALGDEESSQHALLPERVDHAAGKVQKEFLNAGTKLLEMYPAALRLKVRLGTAHQICGKYETLIEAWEAALDSTEMVPERNRSEEEEAVTLNAYETAATCFADLMVACEAWFQ